MFQPFVACCLALFILAPAAPAASSAAPPSAVPFDLQGFIDKAGQAGQQRITIPPGRYRVTPRRAQHLVLRDLTAVQIIADGAELICTETTRAITIAHCRDLTLRGLTIDYDPLPFTQGRIVELSPDKKVHTIELFEGYPDATAVRAFKYEIFRPDTRTLRCEDHDPKNLEVIDARHLRITTSGRPEDPEQVGDIIVIAANHVPGGSAAHAVTIEDSAGIRLQNVTLYASNCFGFLETNCDGTTYDHCRIDRRAADNDPVKRADPRIRSLNADAFHSKHALKGPAYLGCGARFMGDDAVNICGDYHFISACRGAGLRVLAKSKLNIQPGDPVELLAYDGTRLPDARVLAIAPDGRITDDERAFLLRQRMDQNIRTRGCASAYTLTLDRPTTLPQGSLIAAANRMGNGFRVQDCDFGFNRSRGILIKASDGIVAGNRLSANWGEAIKVSPEYWWLESGSSRNVVIRDNTIADCRTMGIAVYAHGGPGELSPAGAHANITVNGNTLTGCPLPNIYLTSTVNLRVKGNTLAPTSTGLNARRRIAPRSEPITIINCTSVTQQHNVIH